MLKFMDGLYSRISNSICIPVSVARSRVLSNRGSVGAKEHADPPPSDTLAHTHNKKWQTSTEGGGERRSCVFETRKRVKRARGAVLASSKTCLDRLIHCSADLNASLLFVCACNPIDMDKESRRSPKTQPARFNTRPFLLLLDFQDTSLTSLFCLYSHSLCCWLYHNRCFSISRCPRVSDDFLFSIFTVHQELLHSSIG